MSRNRTSAKRAGSSFEQATVDYLKKALNQPAVERIQTRYTFEINNCKSYCLWEATLPWGLNHIYMVLYAYIVICLYIYIGIALFIYYFIACLHAWGYCFLYIYILFLLLTSTSIFL